VSGISEKNLKIKEKYDIIYIEKRKRGKKYDEIIPLCRVLA
jgi:hypothetical protein